MRKTQKKTSFFQKEVSCCLGSTNNVNLE